MVIGQRFHQFLSTFSKGFSSETTRPISFKFHMPLSNKEVKKLKKCMFWLLSCSLIQSCIQIHPL